jgi:radical SAM superfamily enzyme YgiQ (UPF0313 family)
MKIVMVCHKYGVSIHDPCFTPTGLLMIAAVLKRAGHDVKWLNHNLWNFDFAEEVKGSDAVCFSGFEEFKTFIARDAAICRDMGIKTILGGALATYLPDEMLEHVDTVVIGEGDEVMDRALAETGRIPGTKPNLNALPFPDVEGFGIGEYNRRHDFVYMNVLTSRGCPGACKFCAQTCHFQFRSLDRVFCEIDLYRKRYRPTMVAFQDNTLNVSRKRFMALCAGMKHRKLQWGCALRADKWDDEMARVAKDSGLIYVVVGVESFIQEKLDRMNKRIKVEQIVRCLDSFHKHGIPYHGNILVGFPWETHTDVMEEINGIPAFYNVFPAMVQPFIGTKYRGRNMSDDEFNQLDAMFRSYAVDSGMTVYPGLAA